MATTQEILASLIFYLEKDDCIEELADDVQKYIAEGTRHLRGLDGHMLPCPFCGGYPIIEKVIRDGYDEHVDDHDAYAYFVTCHACACQGGWAKSQGSAKRNWNMRQPNNGVNFVLAFLAGYAGAVIPLP